jgi:2-polyprenyl-3-methyl-5-hydroxy-6-metoxy-1,4-benzoquinol methylase
MKTAQIGPTSWLWKKETGYYAGSAEELALRPVLPDIGRLRDRRIFELFLNHGGLSRGSRVLEIGCGRSPWLPFLSRRLGCRVAGIDIEPHAAELARANLAGARAAGEIHCGDAFALTARPGLRHTFDLVYSMGVLEHYDDAAARIAVLADYLRPGGRILTTVPNLQGVNWLLQRLADLRTLRAHVVYDRQLLARVHEAAGFTSIASGYAGFFDAHLASAAGATSRVRRSMLRRLCRTLGLGAEAWLRLCGERAAPDLRYVSPHVFYAGRRATPPGPAVEGAA